MLEPRNPRGFKIDATIVSPNRRKRRLPVVPRIWLFHHTGVSEVEGTLHWFQNPKSRVSADFLIAQNGSIFRLVPRGYYAFHAGICTWNNHPDLFYNQRSYGIELAHTGDPEEPWPPIQLEALAYVAAVIQTECPTVVFPRKHGEVAYPRGRKQPNEPAGLTLSKIYSLIHNYQPEVILK
jgi:N-acetylmuramoyl-L-alanine amidase